MISNNIAMADIDDEPEDIVETAPKGLIVKTKIKDYIHSKDCNASNALLDEALDPVITDLLDKAIGRAKENNRKTVMPRDL